MIASPAAVARAQELEAFLLSPACMSDKDGGDSADAAAVDIESLGHCGLSTAEFNAVLLAAQPDLAGMRCRRGVRPVAELMELTYRNGLPLLQDSAPATYLHITNVFRVLVNSAADPSLGDAHERALSLLNRITHSFQSCQAMQAREIDSCFRDFAFESQSLERQLLILVDTKKDQALQATIISGTRSYMDPHTINSYRRSIGEAVGLRGVATAAADYCSWELRGRARAEAEQTFRSRFNLQELLEDVCRAVNTEGGGIAQDSLLQWVNAYLSEHAADDGFAVHDLFYDEGKAEEYAAVGGEPQGDQALLPYLRPGVALGLMRAALMPRG